MFDKTIVKNISSLFSIQIAGYVIPLITLPYLVRTLGMEGYGYLGFSLAITQYAGLLVNYGFDLSATSAIAKCRGDKHKVSEIFWNIILIRLLTFCISTILIILVSIFIPEIKVVLPILMACMIAVLGAALFPQWLFQGKEQLGLISMARILAQVATVPLLLFFVRNSDDIWLAALISSSAGIIVSIYALWLVYARQWVRFVRPTISSIKSQLAEGWHIFISTAAISLYTTSVTVILGFISGPVSVGFFVAAERLIKAVLSIYGTLSNAFYPRVNALVSESVEKAKKLLVKLGILLFSIAAVCSASVFQLAEFVVLLLFGEGHEQTVSILKIMSILPVVISLSNLAGIQILIPFGFKKAFSKILIFSGLISLLILFPMVIVFNELGAALSVVITEVIVTVLMLYTVYKQKIMKGIT